MPVALMPAPVRAPAWVSTRRIFEQKLQELHKCKNLLQIKEVHAQIIKRDLQQDLYVVPKLISGLSNCHQMNLVVNVFNQIQDPNVHLYNTLIRAHVQNYQPSLAFAALFDLQMSGNFPDNFTYPFLLKACNGVEWLPVVRMIHCSVEKFGFFGDLFVPNALIDSYCKCGLLGVNDALKLFMAMGERDVVSWNSMIGGLVKVGYLSRARKLFDEMPVRDTVSWNTMLDGYGKAGEMNEAFNLFEKMPERNVVSWSTMITGFCRAGDMEMAKMLFDRMPVKNVVTWTIIISGFAAKGYVKEAVTLYDQMEKIGIRPDDGTLISILAACAESGLLGLGRRIHSSIERIRYNCSIYVSNSLIDMYAKCGKLDKALSVFNGMSKKDIVSWNCILGGLAMHGHGKTALELFSRMQQEGFKPDKVTLIGVLCACTHAGLINEGRHYFNNMEKDFGITAQIEHYGCMIDLLGRGGCLKEAFMLVQSMPMEPNDVIWGTLLGACRIHNAVELADKVQSRLNASDPGNFSMLSNIFAAAGDWNVVANMRSQMKSVGVQKPSGASSIELDDGVWEFTVFDKSHPKSGLIYEMINKLAEDMKRVDYAPEIGQWIDQ